MASLDNVPWQDTVLETLLTMLHMPSRSSTDLQSSMKFKPDQKKKLIEQFIALTKTDFCIPYDFILFLTKDSAVSTEKRCRREIITDPFTKKKLNER